MSENLEKAQWLLTLGRHEKAAELLARELSLNPENPLALVLLSQCQNRLGQLKAAEETARDAIRHMPELAQAYFALSQSLAKQDKFRDAMEVAKQAARLNPGEPDYPAAIAAILVNQGKFPTALHYAEHALSLDPLHLWALNLRAVSLLGLGKNGEAIQAARQILAQQPETSLALSIEGLGALARKQYDRAENLFDEALRLDPLSSMAQYGKSQLLTRQNGIGRFLKIFFLPQNHYQKIEQSTCALFCLGITLGIFLFPSKVPQSFALILALWGLRFTGPWFFCPLAHLFLGKLPPDIDWEPAAMASKNRFVAGILLLGLLLLVGTWVFPSHWGPLLGVSGALAIQWAWVLAIVFPGGPSGRFFPATVLLLGVSGLGVLVSLVGAQLSQPGVVPTQSEWAGVLLGFLGGFLGLCCLVVWVLGCPREKA